MAVDTAESFFYCNRRTNNRSIGYRPNACRLYWNRPGLHPNSISISPCLCIRPSCIDAFSTCIEQTNCRRRTGASCPSCWPHGTRTVRTQVQASPARSLFQTEPSQRCPGWSNGPACCKPGLRGGIGAVSPADRLLLLRLLQNIDRCSVEFQRSYLGLADVPTSVQGQRSKLPQSRSEDFSPGTFARGVSSIHLRFPR
jgi:hypothetical protein